MLPTFYHCLFMLTCFTTPKPACPRECSCFTAPSNGISGHDSDSILCSNLNSLTSISSQTRFNTIVLHQSQLELSNYIFAKYQTQSIVLDQCQSSNFGISIFKIFNETKVKHLTVLGTTGFSWNNLATFSKLESIYIENSSLGTLDSSFSQIQLPNLRILFIKSARITRIDREAFYRKEKSIQKLVLSDNELQNLIWLTQPNRIFTSLWFLDLRSNRLTYLPSDLQTYIPKVKVLYLANNRFQYYSIEPLAPWLGITELMLESVNHEAQTTSSWNTVYYTKEMSELRKLILEEENPERFPAFFLDSFVEHLRYMTKRGKHKWEFLEQHEDDLFDYLPDNLYLNRNGKLTIGKPVNSVLPEEPIRGLDLRQLPADFTEFSFDSVTNINQYRKAHQSLLGQLKPGTSYRIGLFSKRMFDYFTGEAQIQSDQIRLIADLLEDFLDEARKVNCKIILVMWRIENVDWLKIGQFGVGSRADNVLRLLMKRAAIHPALIGIEILDGFLQRSRGDSGVNPNSTNCRVANPDTLNEMIFLGAAGKLVKKHSGSKLLGLSMDADCAHCLPLALASSCRKSARVELDFDFVTLHSSSGLEEYGFEQFDKKPGYFNVRDDSSAVQARGVFYVIGPWIREQSKIEMIKRIATGYFVAGDVV